MSVSLKKIPDSPLALSPEDEKLLSMWVHGLSPHTRRYYLRDAMLFLECTSTSLADVSLADVQQFATKLANSRLAQSSQAKMLSAIKSLLSFAYKLGITPVNAGAALKSPSPKNALAERILPEVEVQQLLISATNERDRLILRLLYGAALRVSELAGLKWRDVKPRGETGQVTVYGKCGKTRAVLLAPNLWQDLIKLKGNAGWDDPVFKSRKGGHLTTTQVRRIVKGAAMRSPIEPDVAAKVSPHWLRHAHASHSLDKGAPLHLVQATLGHTSISAEMELVMADLRDFRLQYALEPVKDDYEFILLDCPPSLGILTYISLVAATHVLVPVETQFKAFQSLELLLHTVKRVQARPNRNLGIAGFVPTKYDSRNSLDKEILLAMQEQLCSLGQVYPPIVRSTALADATRARKPLALYDPKHPAVTAFNRLAQGIENL